VRICLCRTGKAIRFAPACNDMQDTAFPFGTSLVTMFYGEGFVCKFKVGVGQAAWWTAAIVYSCSTLCLHSTTCAQACIYTHTSLHACARTIPFATIRRVHHWCKWHLHLLALVQTPGLHYFEKGYTAMHHMCCRGYSAWQPASWRQGQW